MPNLFTAGKFKEVNNNGNPADGYLVYIFLAGTTTKTTTYQEFAQSTPNTNPIILDSRGEANIWLPANHSYKVTFTAPSDNLPLNDPYPTGSGIWTQDFIQGGTQFNTATITGNITLTVNDNNKILLVDASSSNIVITPPNAATAGSSYIVYAIRIDNSGNTVTFDPPGAQTVDGQLTFPLTRQYHSASFISSGSAYYTLNNTNLTSLFDTNNNVAFGTIAVTNPSANTLNVSAAAGGVNPAFSATGTDTNIKIKLKGKGTGGTIITDGSSNTLAQFDNGVTSINGVFTVTGNTSIVGSETVTTSDSRTNTVVYPEIIYGSTSGTAATNIGTGTKYQAKSADETPSDIGALQFANSDVTAGSEDTYFSVLIRRAGAALAEAFRWSATGTFKLIQTFAGTADRTITWPDSDLSQYLIQVKTVTTSGSDSTAVTIPYDNTIPQITEGKETLTLAITPKNINNILIIETAHIYSSWAAGFSALTQALFQDATANALAATAISSQGGSMTSTLITKHIMTAGTTSATTFRTRFGPDSGTGYVGADRSGNALFSTAISGWMTIHEYTP